MPAPQIIIPRIPKAPEFCEAWDAVSGARVLKINYRADPVKRTPEWIAANKSGPLAQWMREMEMDESVHAGEPVFRNFVYERHAPAKYRTEPLPWVTGATYYGGWDLGGGTLQLAFVLVQVTPKGWVHWVREVVPLGTMHMSNFAPIVRQRLQEWIPGSWQNVIHIGDPSGSKRQPGGSDFEVAQSYGFRIRPCSAQNPAIRQDAVSWLLEDWIEQEGEDEESWKPRAWYSQAGCPVLVEGMTGAYCMKIRVDSPSSGPGLTWGQPVKNFFSHVNDAHQYAAVEIRKDLLGQGFRGSRRPRRIVG